MTAESKIAYAMQNEAATASVVWFNNPFDLLTWMHPVLEFAMFAGAAFALMHAWRHYRATRSRAFIALWLSIVLHGVLWEIAVFSFDVLDMFWHGEFTVMVYGNRLPLYIVLGYYPAVFYHAFMLARGMGFRSTRAGVVAEALMVGLVFEALYVPCDTLSPITQFWTWDLSHMAAQPVWQNIPANSYLWGLAYGFAYGLLGRKLIAEPEARARLSAAQLVGRIFAVAVLLPVVGMLFIGPVNILVYGFDAHFGASVLIALCFLGAFWVCLLAPKQPSVEPDRLLLVFPALWLSFLATLYVYLTAWLLPSGAEPYMPQGAPPGNVLAGLIALAVAFGIVLKAGGPAARGDESRPDAR